MFTYGLIGFLINMPRFLCRRGVQFTRFFSAFLAAIVGMGTTLKLMLLSRMFWGRGTLYKNIFHYLITFFSAVLLGLGILQKTVNVEASQALAAVSTTGSQDLFTQGGNLQTVLELDPTQPNYQVRYHTVAEAETLESIALEYSVTVDTIRWANIGRIGPFSNRLEIGWQLAIPEINGVLYTVKGGDTLEKIVSSFRANLFQVREINGLVPPDYAIASGQVLLIPDAQPPKWEGKATTEMLVNAFVDPLSHPGCNGYHYYGGFTASHNGVDLGLGGGCPIRAIAAGEVWHAGWWGGGAGYAVIIDHGGGVFSYYYHGDGQIWVKKGEWVEAGQDIMYMGNTGNSSGTHLHLTVKLNGVAINPAPYVPYKVAYPF